jgi:TonB-linked SusC/RagA family outer membrane protein
MKSPNRLRLFMVAAFLALPALLGAQEMRTVSGRVTDAVNLRLLPGVQVSVKGMMIGTLTDGEGTFTFRVPSEATTLVFTYLGYQTVEAEIGGDLNIMMDQQAIGLEGIVVTALGVQREKRSLGYSVQDVSGLEITKVPEVNLVNALQGQVAGVHITNAGPTGGTARIVIRGNSSISGSNQPLFIVDGVPVSNASNSNSGYGGIDYGNLVQDIDPANIESISVLKGPNAAALYGSRASNGAVVITTKSGRTSRGFSFSSSFTTETPLKLPDYQNLYGQGIGGDFRFVDGEGGGTWDFVDESWGPRLDGRLIDQFTGPQQPWVAHPDNVRNFFRSGLTSNTNISFEQSSNRGNVRLSLTNLLQEGMAPGEQINRIGVALKGATSVTDRFNTEASLNYSNQRGENRMGTGYDEDNPMQSFIWFGRQVDMEALRDYRCTGAASEGHACDPNNGQYNWNYNYHNNPFWEQLVNTNEDQRDRLLGHVAATYQVNDWITAMGRVGRDWSRDHRKNVVAFNSLDDAGDGGFGESNIFRSELNTDVTLTAARQLTDDISLDVTTGGNVRVTDYEFSSVNVSALTAPGIYTIDNASETPIANDYESHKKVLSLYGSASFNYGGYFNVDVTGRNDWSSTLPEDNRSYFYPSVSSALVFTDAFGLTSDFLSSGKLRASWTRVGNDTNPYDLTSVLTSYTGFGAAPMFGIPNTLPNATLKPEQTTAYEVGADLGFFRERMGFVLTYYNSETKDQIMPVQISSTSGYTSQILNAGKVRNWGLELLLRATPFQTDDFQWDVMVNWSKNNSEVVELFGDLETLVIGSYWSLNVEARKGEPYGVLFGNGYLTDEQGNWLLDSRGRPQADPVRRVLGNYNPDWNGGIQNRFSYGPFELSVLVDGQRGGDIFSVTNWFGEYAGVLESTIRGREEDFCTPGIVVDGILPDGSVNGDGVNDVTVCPESYFGRNWGNQESGIDDATYLKLREMRLGYELPASLMDRFGFSGGDVAVIGRNLFLWAPNMDNIDPETAFDATNRQGFEFGQFPTARSLGFSISIRP